MTVLVVGLGSIALKHIAAINKIDATAQVYALRSDTKSQKVEGIADVYSTEELNDVSIDFAIISNPTAVHAQAIESLIPKKIPLFIEKPIFSSLGNEKILNEIKNEKIPTYVACNLRFLGCLKFVKSYLQEKRINEVNSYCGSYLPNWRPGKDYRTTYSANQEMGGGVHIDLIHELDYVYWLFGAPNTVQKVFSNQSSLNISAYDYANYLFGFTGFNVSIILNYYRVDAKRTLELVLENETLLVNLLENKVYRNQECLFMDERSIADTYEDQMRFFIEEVVGNNAEFNTAHEAYEILKICLKED